MCLYCLILRNSIIAEMSPSVLKAVISMSGIRTCVSVRRLSGRSFGGTEWTLALAMPCPAKEPYEAKGLPMVRGALPRGSVG
jgi:hypothetical protein